MPCLLACSSFSLSPLFLLLKMYFITNSKGEMGGMNQPTSTTPWEPLDTLTFQVWY